MRPYLDRQAAAGRSGVAAIGVSQEFQRVWAAYQRQTKTAAPQCTFAKADGRVTCYYFYLWDEGFGPAFIKVCAYFPYPAKVNGHEWARRQALRAGLGYRELSNGFASCQNPALLQKICDRLGPASIESFAQRWLHRLPMPLTRDDERSGYWWELSMRQVEVSRTIVFDAPRRARAFFEALIADNLDIGRPASVGIIFDRRIRRDTKSTFRTTIEPPGDRPGRRRGRAEHLLQELRSDGHGREIADVGQALMDMFSSRRASIGALTARLAQEYQAQVGRAPDARALASLRQWANHATRRAKDAAALDLGALVSRWSAQATAAETGTWSPRAAQAACTQTRDAFSLPSTAKRSRRRSPGFAAKQPVRHQPLMAQSPTANDGQPARRELGPRAATAGGRSAPDCVVQVQHAVALDHLVGIAKEDGAGVAAEEAHPCTQNHRGDVHRDLVDQTCRERLPADVAGRHADQTITGELPGERDARLDRPGGVEGRVGVVGEPRLRQWAVGDNDQLVSGGRVAVPAVRGVEQVTADHRHLDGVPEGLDVIRGCLRDMEPPAARSGGHLGISVAVPVEQRPDRVIGIGDVAVHRHDRLHDNLGHLRSLAERRNVYVRRFDEDIQLARRSMIRGRSSRATPHQHRWPGRIPALAGSLPEDAPALTVATLSDLVTDLNAGRIADTNKRA